MNNFNLSEWAIKNPVLVLYALIALLLSGGYSYSQLAQKEDPDFTFKVMAIGMQWPGATAREMAGQVTDKIEEALRETPWLEKTTSYSQAGSATVFVTLKDGIPPDELIPAWREVRKILARLQTSLPEGVSAPLFNDELGDTFGSILAVVSEQSDYAGLEREARRVQAELLKIASVAKVKLIGTQAETIFVEFSSGALAKTGVTPQQIAEALKAQTAMEPAGAIDTGLATARLRVGNTSSSLANLQNLVLSAQGRTYRLGELCRVYRGYEDPARFKMKVMGKHAVGLAVKLDTSGDVIKLGESLDEIMGRLRAELPAGMDIQRVSDQPGVVKKSTGELMQSLLEALAIVLAISFVSLGWRAGTVVALSIPVVIAGTFLLMKWFGIDLQRVSIGALIISIGLLVDDAMIAVEMMKVKLEEGLGKAQAAVYAYKSTAFPMLTGTLITAAAFMPVGLAESEAGEYTFSICVVVTIALLVSWLVAVLFTPLLGYKLLHEHPLRAERLYQNRFYHGFRKLVVACLRYRKTTLFVTAAIFLLSLASFTQVQQQFFPPSERPELLVDIWLPEGATLAASEARAEEFVDKLRGLDGVVHHVSYIGGPAPRFYLPLEIQLPVVNYAQLVVTTRDSGAREVALQRIRTIIETDYKSAGIRVSRLENGPPVGYPVQFRVIGENLETLRAIAGEVLRVVRDNPHARDASQDSEAPFKTIRLDIDQEKARSLGLSTPGLSRQLQMLLSSSVAGHYREEGKQIAMVMRAADEERRSPAALARAVVYSDSGAAVPLAAIAKPAEAEEPGIFWRLNRQPVVTVRADIPDSAQAPDVSRAIDKNLSSIRSRLPSGYRIEAGGAWESSAQSQDSILAVLPLMSFIILSLLMAQLKRFNQVLLVLLTAPLGLIGVTAALLLFQVPFGFVAMLGIISLAGMIMRNSVILVDQIEQDVALGLSRYEAIVDSTVRRARPILLTAAAAMLAMIPLTTSVFWGPMAVVIMGGLLVATVLTLLFLPALYATWFRVNAV